MSYFTMSYGMLPQASPEEVKRAVEELAPSLIDDKMSDYAKKDELDDYATTDEISGFVTETKATQIAGNVATSKINTEKESGTMDDIRVYNTRDSFPSTGVSDVEYIAKDTGLEYIWNGSEYTALGKHEVVDIDDLNWD